MSDPLSSDEPAATADGESAAEVREQVTTTLATFLRENTGSAATLRALGAEQTADKVVRQRRRRPRKPGRRPIDWSTPPYVDPGAADDFREMMGKRYKGSNESMARARFTEHGADYDNCTATAFAAMIDDVRNDVDVSDSLGPALHYYCQYQIPEQHREGWAIAIMAAYDRHEDD